MVGEVQLEDGATVLGEDGGVASGLGGDEVTEGELATGDREVLTRRRRDLHVDTDGRPTLVELAGRVQEPGAPAEGRRAAGALGDLGAYPCEVGVAEAVEVGHDRDVAALRVELAEQGVERLGDGRG